MAHRFELLGAVAASASGDGVSPPQLVHAIVQLDIDAAFDRDGRDTRQSRLIGLIYLDRAVFVQDEVARDFALVAERFMPLVDALS